MPDVINIPFNGRFTARLASGLASARPGVPAGVGDAYYAPDTGILSLADEDGTAWLEHDLSEIGQATFVGVKARRTSSFNLTANGSSSFLELTASDVYDTHAFHNPSSNPERLIIPEGMAGYYQFIGQVSVAMGSVVTAGIFRLELLRFGDDPGSIARNSLHFDADSAAGVDDQMQVSGISYLEDEAWVGMTVVKSTFNSNTDPATFSAVTLSMHRVGT